MAGVSCPGHPSPMLSSAQQLRRQRRVTLAASLGRSANPSSGPSLPQRSASQIGRRPGQSISGGRLRVGADDDDDADDDDEALPTIDLPADELAAVTAAIRGVIEGDRYPHAPRLDPLRAALAKFDAELQPDPLRKAPPVDKGEKRARR